MESVIKGFLLVFFLGLSFSFGSNLESRWQNALNSPPSSQREQWQSWIAEAKTENTQSAEAYFNLARAFWETDEPARSIEALLISAQIRNSVFQSWKDLKLFSDIQWSLLNTPPPSNHWKFRLLLLKDNYLKWIWIFGLCWLALITLVLRFGLRRRVALAYKLSGATWLLVFLTGIVLDFFATESFSPLILDNGKEPVLFYSGPDNQQDKISELPSGLVVMPFKKEGDWVFINEPVEGWFEERLSLALPKHSMRAESFSLSPPVVSDTD